MMSKSTSSMPLQPSRLKNQSQRPSNSLLYVGFNHNYSSIACGTKSGYQIHSIESTEEIRRDIPSGGIVVVEMLNKTNRMALVSRNDPKKVVLWDDHSGRCIDEHEYRGVVRGVRLRLDRFHRICIVVILEYKIYIHKWDNPRAVQKEITTLSNMNGLCAIATKDCLSELDSTNESGFVLAYPGVHKGEVEIGTLYGNKTWSIHAHESALACLALNSVGSLLATASVRGTRINIFNTIDRIKLQELRRGAIEADIFSMVFSPHSQWLVLSSEHKKQDSELKNHASQGTVHLFSIKEKNNGLVATSNRSDITQTSSRSGTSVITSGSAMLSLAAMASGSGVFNVGSSLFSLAANVGSPISYVKGMLPNYFSLDRSVGVYRLPEGSCAIAAFGPQKHTINIVCKDGRVFRCSFDPLKAGEMLLQDTFFLM